MRGGKRENAGRKKGSRNKKTLSWNEYGRQLLAYGLPRTLRILKRCSDGQFMDRFPVLLRFFKSHAKEAVDVTIHDSDVEKWLRMSNEELARQIEQYEAQRKIDLKYNSDGTRPEAD